MRYVILRDDDTNALTPVECLERLYRPFLDRNLPVNLAVIPDVDTNALTPDGKPEGFLFAKNGIELLNPSHEREENHCHRGVGAKLTNFLGGIESKIIQKPASPTQCRPLPGGEGQGEGERKHSTIPIGQNPELVSYLRRNSGYNLVQHGCHHDCFEFNRQSPAEISARLERGLKLFAEAGFERPVTFVAPHDKISRASYREVTKRFEVISSGWFELERLPMSWWPKYFQKKIRHTPHWRIGETRLLSHPGCLLSAHRNFDAMLDTIRRAVSSQKLTVLVTHWWEYFPNGRPHENFIRILHQTAEYLASEKDLRVISFTDLVKSDLRLN